MKHCIQPKIYLQFVKKPVQKMGAYTRCFCSQLHHCSHGSIGVGFEAPQTARDIVSYGSRYTQICVSTTLAYFISWYLPYCTSPLPGLWQVCHIKTFNLTSLKGWLTAVGTHHRYLLSFMYIQCFASALEKKVW